jgi:hypothetical protein
MGKGVRIGQGSKPMVEGGLATVKEKERYHRHQERERERKEIGPF